MRRRLPFLWSGQHQQEAFDEANALATSAPCLAYHDVNAPVILQVDASDYGLAAAFLQPSKQHSSNTLDESCLQPVAYSSKSLSPTEQRYAQIEKECLAIVEAFNKFDQWPLVKSDITVHTDHQPLQSIFQRYLASAPKSLQNMMLFLQRYNFTVVYRKGSSLHLADTLSRAPCRDEATTPCNFPRLSSACCSLGPHLTIPHRWHSRTVAPSHSRIPRHAVTGTLCNLWLASNQRTFAPATSSILALSRRAQRRRWYPP